MRPSEAELLSELKSRTLVINACRVGVWTLPIRSMSPQCQRLFNPPYTYNHEANSRYQLNAVNATQSRQQSKVVSGEV